MKPATLKAQMRAGFAIKVVRTLHKLADGAPTESNLAKLQKLVKAQMQENGIASINISKTPKGDSHRKNFERHARIIKLYIKYTEEIEINNTNLKNFIKSVKEASNGTWETELVIEYPEMGKAYNDAPDGLY
jgi:uncharacterized protein (DUF1697 family)